MIIKKLLFSSVIYFQLARFFLVTFIGILAVRIILIPLVRFIFHSRNTDPKKAQTVQNLIGLAGIFTVLLIALQVASFGNLLTVLGTLAAALTVAVGFGMRDQVSSLVSGVFIKTDNPFLDGDYIKIGDESGVVKEINFRSTTLKSGSHEKIVPNNLLTGGTVTKYTRGTLTSQRIGFPVKVGKAGETARILEESADKTSDILANPEPAISMNPGIEDKIEVELEYFVRNTADIKKARTGLLKKFDREAEERKIFETEETGE